MASPASLHDLGLVCPEGDVLSARTFAERLLRPVANGRETHDARLLLTALCLHLMSAGGPGATVFELLTWLEAGRSRLEAFATLGSSPMQLLVFAHAEWLSLAPNARSLAVDLCLSAAKLASSQFAA